MGERCDSINVGQEAFMEEEREREFHSKEDTT